MSFFLQNIKTKKYFVEFESLDSHSAKALNNYSIRVVTSDISSAKEFGSFPEAFQMLLNSEKLRKLFKVVEI